MAPPRQYHTDEERTEAIRLNGIRYKNKKFLCETCDTEVLLGNRRKHFSTTKHQLFTALRISTVGIENPQFRVEKGQLKNTTE